MTKEKHIHREKIKRLTKGKYYSNILITRPFLTATDYHTSQNLLLGNETQRTILKMPKRVFRQTEFNPSGISTQLPL